MNPLDQHAETPDEFAARLRNVVNSAAVPCPRPRRSASSRKLLSLRERLLRAALARGIRVDEREVTLDHFTGERLAYEPCGVLTTRRALSLVPDDCRHTLVEFGCGMGLVACLAARQGFRHVIGVDISESLTARARENAQRERSRSGSAPVDIVTADAGQWQIPDETTAAFLFCPYTGDIFGAWLARVRESLERRPRAFVIAYVYPIETSRLLNSGLFVEIARRRGGRLDDPAWRIVIYRHDPAKHR